MATNEEIRAKDISPHKESLEPGDGFYGDGPQSFFMEAIKLLELTAENALAGNVAPAFDPTRTIEDPYKVGEVVIEGGELYSCQTPQAGEWVRSNFNRESIYNYVVYRILKNLEDVTSSASVIHGKRITSNGNTLDDSNCQTVTLDDVSGGVVVFCEKADGTYGCVEFDSGNNIVGFKSFVFEGYGFVNLRLDNKTTKIVLNLKNNTSFKLSKSGIVNYNNIIDVVDSVIEKCSANLFDVAENVTSSSIVTDGCYKQASGSLVQQVNSRLYALTVENISSLKVTAVFNDFSWSFIEVDSNENVIRTTMSNSVEKIVTDYLVLTPLTTKVYINTANCIDAVIEKCNISRRDVNSVVEKGAVAEDVVFEDVSQRVEVVEGKRYTSNGNLIDNSDCKVVRMPLDVYYRHIHAKMAFHPDAYSEFWLDDANNVINTIQRSTGELVEFVESLPTNVAYVCFNCIIQSPVFLEIGITRIYPDSYYIKMITDRLNAVEHASAESTSRYSRGHIFGDVPSSSYICMQQDYMFGASQTSYADVIAAYDALADNDHMKKVNIGTSSDGQTLYAYTLKPALVRQPSGYTNGIPGVFILCGQHGFEKGSSFGTYYFVKDLVENYDKNDLLRYLRNNVNIYIVPVANPYGFDNNLYDNANDVNLNRNWDVPGWTALNDSSDTSQNTGLTPFDQPETDAIHDFVLNNLSDIDLFIDYHTNGRDNVSTAQDVNWMSVANYSVYSDEYSDRLNGALVSHAQEVSGLVRKIAGQALLGTATDNVNVCNITKSSVFPTTGYAPEWAVTQGIIGFTFEGFNAFPNGNKYISEEKKSMATMIACVVKNCLNVFSK